MEGYIFTSSPEVGKGYGWTDGQDFTVTVLLDLYVVGGLRCLQTYGLDGGGDFQMLEALLKPADTPILPWT